MKLVRNSEIQGVNKPDGRTVKTLLEHSFGTCVEGMTLYLCNVPGGRFEKHYHTESEELICFPKGGKITVNDDTYDMGEWDIVLLEPGDTHCYQGDTCPDIIHFAIRFSTKDDRVKVED